MRSSCTIGLLLVFAVGQSALGYQIMLSPSDDAQFHCATSPGAMTMTNPPSYGILLSHRHSTTGELNMGRLEYSLASLPGNAVVTAASFTYEVGLTNTSGQGAPVIDLLLYDGGDGEVTLEESGGVFPVGQSDALTSLDVYTTDFASVDALNNRATNFPNGYVGLCLFNFVESYDVSIWSAEDAQAYGFQPPVITITYVVPEPASLSLLVAVGTVLLIGWRNRKSRR